MARKNANYEFEDGTDLDQGGVDIGDESGALTIKDIEQDSGKDEAPLTDGELFDDLPNSPFKSDPTEDGMTRERKPKKDEDEDLEEVDPDEVDEDDEDEEEQTASKDDEEDEPEDEDDDMPKSWRKRLLRQERLLNEVREENKQIAERNRALERSQKSRESEQEFVAKKTGLESKIDDARKALADAHENGAAGTVVAELTEKLADLKGELRAEQVLHDQRKAADKEAPPVTRQPRLAQQWMRKHQKFQTDPVFQAAAKAVDRQIAQEGFDPETDAYYQELDKRLRKNFPDEYKTARNRDGGERQRRAPTQHMGRSQGTTRGAKPQDRDFTRRGNTVILSPKAKANMRKFGLDPDNKSDAATYVRENRTK